METPFGPPIDDEACDRSSLAEITAVFSKRWTGGVLLALSRGADRFGQIEGIVTGISARMLSARLRELEHHGLVARVVTPTVPVSVRYSLTARGRVVLATMQQLTPQPGRLEDASHVA
ncbi:winged helix-turn-helix transcriptional regulator [Kineosporia succinea]|uniref:DNA-binding HxlR family transcriptional regulator n=1 Tax=Kineosporia succinea TaxID=84632 RepID=A0ABT9P839_9ACTN|nr:helix-turn-helix domain-containing protein [Kineosporia succinea]MDP9828866.1 DNA-binding HxlR family transcriptional regulator [Kineosporia succinea]